MSTSETRELPPNDADAAALALLERADEFRRRGVAHEAIPLLTKVGEMEDAGADLRGEALSMSAEIYEWGEGGVARDLARARALYIAAVSRFRLFCCFFFFCQHDVLWFIGGFLFYNTLKTHKITHFTFFYFSLIIFFPID